MSRENKTKIIISIALSVVLLLGATYALWTFSTEKTNIVMTVGGDQITFDAGANITVDGLLPTYSMYSDTNVVTKDIVVYKQTDDYIAGINLYLKLATWPSAMSSASFRWALYKNGEYLSSGSFANTSQGNSVRLTSNTQPINLESDKDTYKLYMWIDAYQESNINMMNKSFTINLYGQATFDEKADPSASESTPNAPDLIDGLIPIKYDYVTDEWVKADSTNTDNNWYDYYNKKWANAVMVSSNTRNTYMNAPVNTTVAEDDILAYYVWIPRYRYVLFNTSFEAVKEREIQIEFQSTTDEISSGTQNGEYLTHPAFWWDNNSDGIRTSDEELAGIWVGKFETSGDLTSPMIKSSQITYRSDNLYDHFFMHRKFLSLDYLTVNGVNYSDTHMMKNTEWGVVAYLSKSKYGNNIILKNNNSQFITGRQGNYTYNDFIIVDGELTKNKEVGTGTLASTTGNVYGIYDMSGGVHEAVMAVQKNTDGSFVLNTGHLYGFNDTTLAEIPNSYYDIYAVGTSELDYTRSILGDAIGEINGWYGSNPAIITSSAPWFTRGSTYFGPEYSFLNSTLSNNGYVRGLTGSRSVLIRRNVELDS